MVLTEFALRLHTTIVNHIKSFSYNITGTMILAYDVTEYKFVCSMLLSIYAHMFRKCIASWSIDEIKRKFEALHALVNLMIVPPENLTDSTSAAALSSVDQSLINHFISLRHDAKLNRN